MAVLKSGKVSVSKVARAARTADSTVRKSAVGKRFAADKATVDSFVNFAHAMGVGADNPLTTASYGFNPVTRVRQILEWIYRGSWLGGQAIDIPAEDMTREGVTIESTLSPDKIKEIEAEVTRLAVWEAISDNIKWARLYGGSIAVMLVEHQKLSTPLRIETVGKDQFKGVVVLDRWMLDPSLNDLVTEPGPQLGDPKYYTVIGDAPALGREKIHYSRVIRLEGITLPFYSKIQENYWGISILERLYDRMIAYDSASTGAAQLVYKAYIRTYKVKGLRNIIASGNKAMDGLVGYIDLMRRFQGIEGLTLMDLEDEFEGKEQGSFQGLANLLDSFGEQISGATNIPLIRFFGQSPRGFSDGETNLRNYYDWIKGQQTRHLLVPLTNIYKMTTQSLGIKIPKGFGLEFRSLWQLSDEQKAGIANTLTTAISTAEEGGLISQQTAMKELKQSSKITNVYSNIEDADIKAAEESLPPAGENAMGAEGGFALGTEAGEEKNAPKPAAPKTGGGGAPAAKGSAETKPSPKKTKDNSALVAHTDMKRIHDLDVLIENARGSLRRGVAFDGQPFETKMPYDYGYLQYAGEGGDGDPLDCIVGEQHDSGEVFLINQYRLDGTFDEYKVLLGYPAMSDAIRAYIGGYGDPQQAWDQVKGCQRLSMDEFKSWIKDRK